MAYTKISKEYRWEMGHRLEFHNGLCSNIHGHSYKMVIEIGGMPDKTGMIIDFYDLDKIVVPIVAKFDHAFVCNKKDKKTYNLLNKLDTKLVVVDFYTTVENFSKYFAEYFAECFSRNKKFNNITVISLKIFETHDSSAEYVLELLG